MNLSVAVDKEWVNNDGENENKDILWDYAVPITSISESSSEIQKARCLSKNSLSRARLELASSVS